MSSFPAATLSEGLKLLIPPSIASMQEPDHPASAACEFPDVARNLILGGRERGVYLVPYDFTLRGVPCSWD